MIEERRALLESLGGLPETTVRNQEWLDMLEEDTRQSLAIEGHFATSSKRYLAAGSCTAMRAWPCRSRDADGQRQAAQVMVGLMKWIVEAFERVGYDGRGTVLGAFG
jgi:hypothetical protein